MDSNIGEYGAKSVRINDLKPENLPIGEAARAIPACQEADAITERANKIAEIHGKYPKHDAAYLKGAIKEAHDNIGNVGMMKVQQTQTISEYTALLSMCAFRDKELDRLDDVEDKEEIKALKLRFPPYNIKAMNQQIKQCEEALVRCEDVFAQENATIQEFSAVLALVTQRDKELDQLG